MDEDHHMTGADWDGMCYTEERNTANLALFLYAQQRAERNKDERDQQKVSDWYEGE